MSGTKFIEGDSGAKFIIGDGGAKLIKGDGGTKLIKGDKRRIYNTKGKYNERKLEK